MNGSFVKNFRQILQTKWNNVVADGIQLKPFKTQIELLNPAFVGRTQQDAHEFLYFLMEKLHEELNRADPDLSPPPKLPFSFT